jgi:small subunit ribosomal protein S2
MFTNWKTVSKSLNKLNKIEKDIANADKLGLTKKEVLMLERQRVKLENVFCGIKEINGTPDLMIVIDTQKEQLAIDEARVLGVPVIGICDTNSQIDEIDFPVPGNDDAIRALELYCSLLSKSALEGVKEQVKASGKDLGAEEAPKTEAK